MIVEAAPIVLVQIHTCNVPFVGRFLLFAFRINSPLLVTAIVDDERLSAEQMDERRRQNIAYEYLCHLEEAKR